MHVGKWGEGRGGEEGEIWNISNKSKLIVLYTYNVSEKYQKCIQYVYPDNQGLLEA